MRLTLASPEETEALAQRLSKSMGAADVILLSGEIGAGKTHFARTLIQALLPYPEDVPSPTFTLVQTYETETLEIWHSDLYRLTSPDEVIELGLIEAFETAICLVEWPDRLEDLAPQSALSMAFEMTEITGERILTITWDDARWDERMSELSHD
jgi:tRNA threonylcarbamoyl adenosine modification protein YjeE